MKRKALVSFLSFVSMTTHAQTYQWTTTNSPTASFRYEDVYFLNADTGFAVHYNDVGFGGEPGFIMKTMDGGNTWIKVLDSTEFHFRDVGFTDAMHGWVGTINHTNTGADTNIIYKTIDGGITWSGVDNLPGPDSAGICGLRVINDSTLYGAGRYYGPANFYKTTDNGQTWSYQNLDSLVSGLVDIFFFDPDTGFVIGTTGPSYNNGYGRVLYTTDGGNSWSIVHTSTHHYTLGWKIVFPSRNIGYCSLQCFNQCNTEAFLKTTDGGSTWQDISYVGGPSNWYDVEGIGFVNDTVGWVGGNTNTYFTQNGGASWTLQTWGNNLNRFRFLSGSVGYSAGQSIYKMHISATGIVELENNDLMKSYPNPATDFAYFEFALDQSMHVRLSVYDINGKEVELVFDKIFNGGNQHFMWQPENLPQGIYTSVLRYGNNIAKRKLEILK
jgi:photosystem II stability/assembly factor-like uncharacterized protein